MEIASFEKFPKEKRVEFNVFVENANIFLEVPSVEMKISVDAMQHYKHGWLYEVRNPDFIKALGGKERILYILHESAEKAYEAAEKQREEKRVEEERHLEEEFRRLSDDTSVKISWGTSHQHAWVPDSNVGKHRFFKEAIEIMKKAKFSSEKIEEVLNRKADDVDWGDYSITYDYRMIFGELKLLVKAAKEENEKIENEKAKKEAEQKEKLDKLFEEAKRTGEKVEIRRWTTSCNDPNEECDLDTIIEYAMPDGSIKKERYHTW
ncbi:hypothetical protein P9850_01925 [Anoxybacillus rupiensis]|uniref:Large polyvalent protein associated domain-containing protein n=1 Tax=Anoxybacteroides rupiense TaxID=311460 RepID=A0ABD5IQS5_9BACL|nr:hypothetical protein [Anoxybacillus rupiensis]